jgi:hypothetical protein
MEYANLQARMITGDIGNIKPNLTVAQQRIINQIAFTGITELYDTSHFLFMLNMGWKPKHYPKVNITQHFPQVPLSKQTLQALTEKNDVDLKLYDFALKKFNGTVSSLPKETLSQLKAFMASKK